MAIKDQMSATEQIKKIDEIQDSHMVGGWGREVRGGEEREGQPCTQGLERQKFLPAP